MELIDVVRKLIGPVDPVGEHYADEERFRNLQKLTELVDSLAGDIDRVAENRNRQESSMSHAGWHARKFLISLGIYEG